MAEVELDDELEVAAETLAALFGVTPRYARTFGVRLRHGRYDLLKSVQSYVRFLRDRPANRGPWSDGEVCAALIAELGRDRDVISRLERQA